MKFFNNKKTASVVSSTCSPEWHKC